MATQLLRRCANDTGEIDDGKFTPRIERLAIGAKLSEKSAGQGLGWLIGHGWFVRYQTSDRKKVAGLLKVGRDSEEAVPVCEQCGKPLLNRRSDARSCSERCKKAAQRARDRQADAEARRDTEAEASRDMSPLEPGHAPFIEGTSTSVFEPADLLVVPASVPFLQREPRREEMGENWRSSSPDRERRPGGCPLCEDDHPGCEFAAGSLVCRRFDCANPHHRRALDGRSMWPDPDSY